MSKMIFNGLEFVNGVQINELYPICYDTDEHEVGCWTDGKPLYQKTIEFDTGVTASNISFDISSYMPSDCVVVDNNIIISFSFDGDDYYFVNRYDISGYSVENNTHYIKFGIGQARYNKHVIFTIWYTKTTDIAGSGTWNSQGQYAHHYSEDEKVVGTWIDGKPLYERVFTGLSISGGGWKDTGIDSSPMDIIPFGRAIDNANQSYDITIGKSNNHVYIRYTTDGQDIIKLILQYTKTTD